MTENEKLRLVSSNEETSTEGRQLFSDDVLENLLQEPKEIRTEEDLKGALTQEIAYALLRWWFPNRLPVGDDYQKWVEISLKDAEAVTNHLIGLGIIKAEPNDD
jgi:hypothetical protein